MAGNSNSSKASASNPPKGKAKDCSIQKGPKKAPKTGKDRKTYRFYRNHLTGLKLLWHLGDLRYNPHTGEFGVINEDPVTARAYGIQCGASMQSNPAQKWRHIARTKCPPELLTKSLVPVEQVHLPQYGIYPLGHDLYGMSHLIHEDCERQKADQQELEELRHAPPHHHQTHVDNRALELHVDDELQTHQLSAAKATRPPPNADCSPIANNSYQTQDWPSPTAYKDMNVHLNDANLLNHNEMFSPSHAAGGVDAYTEGYIDPRATSLTIPSTPGYTHDNRHHTYHAVADDSSPTNINDGERSPPTDNLQITCSNLMAFYPTPSRSTTNILRHKTATLSYETSDSSYTNDGAMNGLNNISKIPRPSGVRHNVSQQRLDPDNVYEVMDPFKPDERQTQSNMFTGDKTVYYFEHSPSDLDDFGFSYYSNPAGQEH